MYNNIILLSIDKEWHDLMKVVNLFSYRYVYLCIRYVHVLRILLPCSVLVLKLG